MSAEEAADALELLIAQDRRELNFRDYSTSESHRELMLSMPEYLHIPREDWHSHPNHQGMYMVHYHVGFREHMSIVLRLLYRFHEQHAAHAAGRGKLREETLIKTLMLFREGCNALAGHVDYEETTYFPYLSKKHSGVDLSALYESHTELHQVQGVLFEALEAAVQAKSVLSEQEIVHLLEAAFKYDNALINHMGEEEELVAPLELAAGEAVGSAPAGPEDQAPVQVV